MLKNNMSSPQLAQDFSGLNLGVAVGFRVTVAVPLVDVGFYVELETSVDALRLLPPDFAEKK